MRKAKATKKTKAVNCKLGQLLQDFLTAQKTVNKLPESPIPPTERTSYTVKEWNAYLAEKAAYKGKLERYKEMKAAAINRLEIARQAVETYLPKAHAWFITEDKRFAVALQGSDWPGDRYRVIYRENPVIDELPKLRCQVIN